MGEDLLCGSLWREMKRVGVSPETLKHSALFSAAKELLVELIWKGRYVQKQTHPHKGRQVFEFLRKYRGYAVLFLDARLRVKLSEVKSQQSLASPWLGGEQLAREETGAVEENTRAGSGK